MKIGLIGLGKSGKTTLFNLLTGSSVATARYDSGRAELHTGVARVPDPRVDRLTALFKPKKTTYATFEVVDLAGIAKGERAGLDTLPPAAPAKSEAANQREGTSPKR